MNGHLLRSRLLGNSHVLLCTFRLPRFLRPCIWTIPEQAQKTEFLDRLLARFRSCTSESETLIADLGSETGAIIGR